MGGLGSRSKFVQLGTKEKSEEAVPRDLLTPQEQQGTKLICCATARTVEARSAVPRRRNTRPDTPFRLSFGLFQMIAISVMVSIGWRERTRLTVPRKPVTFR